MINDFLNGAARDDNSGGHQPQYTTMELSSTPSVAREGTADVVNDPRFYNENVLDKRLAAFEAVAIVMEIMASEAIKQCYELPADFEIVGPFYHVAIFQIIGFSIMISVLFMSTVATAVLSLQLFFAIRLMTAGPTGFDKSATFYTDTRMWRWRERAIFGVKWSIVCFFVSPGFMLYVKLYTEGAPKKTVEHDEEEGRIGHNIFSAAALVLFLILSGILTCMVRTHQRAFDES